MAFNRKKPSLLFSDNNKFTIMVGYEDIQYKNCGDSGRYVNVPAASVINFSSYTSEITSFCGPCICMCGYKDGKTTYIF